MKPYKNTVRQVSRRISGAISRSVSALREGRVEHEPAMTDRMLGAIEEALSGYTVKGIRWNAKTLTDRGRGSQESIYGADFMGVLEVSLPDLRVSKGFLAQAKLVRNGSSGALAELKRQCDKMLNLSSDSFVFLYGVDGVRVVPAVAVVGSDLDPLQLYNRSASRFFEEHLQCFIGDRNIQAPTPQALESLSEKFEARSALLLQAESNYYF